MRRGLIAWSKAELPPALFERRVARAQAAMSAAGLDALAIYTNHTRPCGAWWFTGFVPYWSEGMLVVPRRGPTLLAVALSKRVQDWIERVAAVGEVVSGPRFGLAAGRAIADEKPGARIGVLELDDLPSGTGDELQSADARTELVDATGLIEGLRLPSDAAEIALAARAAAIARDALACASAGAADDAAVVAAVEREARRSGAEEVLVAIAPDLLRDDRFVRAQGAPNRLGGAFAVRATVAYKGVWVRMARTVARDPALADAVNVAVDELASAAACLPETGGFAGASAWLVEATTRSQPLEPCAGSVVAQKRSIAGAVVTLALTLPVGGVPIIAAAPALAGNDELPGALLVAPVFA